MWKRAARYTWTVVDIRGWTTQVKYMCGKHATECCLLAQRWLLLLPVETGLLSTDKGREKNASRDSLSSGFAAAFYIWWVRLGLISGGEEDEGQDQSPEDPITPSPLWAVADGQHVPPRGQVQKRAPQTVDLHPHPPRNHKHTCTTQLPILNTHCSPFSFFCCTVLCFQ